MDAKRSLSDRRYEDVVTLSDVDDVNDLLKLGFAMTTKNIRVSEPHE
jgi:hypothetical protein